MLHDPVTPPPQRSAAPRADGKPARVLLVDDSIVVRSVLERIIGGHGDFAICGSLGNAADAVTFLRNDIADIVILDVEMPDRSGLEALPDILKYGGDARVLVLSSNCGEGGTATLRALSLGACDTLAKPGRTSFAGSFAEVLLTRLAQLAQLNAQVTPPAGKLEFSPPPSLPPAPSQDMKCIAIGASTGGIPALHAFVSALGVPVDAPILITQHLPPVFIPYLVQQLGGSTSRKVLLGMTGMRLLPNHIYIAPGDGHLTVEHSAKGGQIRILGDKAGSRYMPAVDPMFASVAAVFGSRALAVILSGMGNDGLAGADKLVAVGASVFAQDAGSSVVWGMPGNVARAGLASAILSPTDIAGRVSGLWEGAK